MGSPTYVVLERPSTVGRFNAFDASPVVWGENLLAVGYGEVIIAGKTTPGVWLGAGAQKDVRWL
jgi:hypothetical protein